MDGVTLHKLKQINHPKGDIYHVIKNSSKGFRGFGESYVSKINHGAVKGWKKHLEMTLNLVVVFGKVKFVVFDGSNFLEIILSPEESYNRLTIKPGLWLAFQGLSSEDSIILNVADIKHDPEESHSAELSSFKYDW